MSKKKQQDQELGTETPLTPESAESSETQTDQDVPEAEDLAQVIKQRDEYLQMAQRVQADFDNFRRRNRQVSAESFDDGARAFIKTLLPVCDNLERALQEPRTEDPLYQGVSLVHRQLMTVLEQRGVTTINRLGEPFDPKLEEAIAQAGPEEGEPGTVCDVVLKGYIMGETVLRHAMVRVVAG
ncbi:MAG: nucleotide exchange factor GrpE [Bacillota bacterium]|nr:nucleotide exchange factor GrpE [Bacillota bacterium]